MSIYEAADADTAPAPAPAPAPSIMGGGPPQGSSMMSDAFKGTSSGLCTCFNDQWKSLPLPPFLSRWLGLTLWSILWLCPFFYSRFIDFDFLASLGFSILFALMSTGMLWLSKFLDMPVPVADLTDEEKKKGGISCGVLAGIFFLSLVIVMLIDDDYDNEGGGSSPPGVPPRANIDARCTVHEGIIASQECMPGLYKMVKGTNEPVDMPSGGPYHSGAQVVVFPFAMNYSTAECFCHAFHDGHLATVKTEGDFVAIKLATEAALLASSRSIKHPVLLGAKQWQDPHSNTAEWVWSTDELVTPAEKDFLFGGAKSPASDDPNNCAPLGPGATDGGEDSCTQGVSPPNCEYCMEGYMPGPRGPSIFTPNGLLHSSNQCQSAGSQKCMLSNGISHSDAGPELGTCQEGGPSGGANGCPDGYAYNLLTKRATIYMDGTKPIPGEELLLGFCDADCVTANGIPRAPVVNNVVEGGLYAMNTQDHDFGFPACMFPKY